MHIYLSLEFLISSFSSSYSVNILSIETTSSCLISESIKTLEIKTCVVFNLIFASNTTRSCIPFFFLIIDLYFLIPAVIGQMFFTEELVIPTGIPTKEAKPEI